MTNSEGNFMPFWAPLAGRDATILEPIDAPDTGRQNWTPVAPIARAVMAAVAAEGITWTELAHRVWGATSHHTSDRSSGDTSRLLRRLGLSLTGGVQQRYIRYETATRIIRAAGIAPVDVGL